MPFINHKLLIMAFKGSFYYKFKIQCLETHTHTHTHTYIYINHTLAKIPANCMQGKTFFLQHFCVLLCSQKVSLSAPHGKTWQGQRQPSPVMRQSLQMSQQRTRDIRRKNTFVGRATVWVHISDRCFG